MQSNNNNVNVNAIAPGLSCQIKEVIPDNWNSIFIPRISFDMTRQELGFLIETQLSLGSISRIDFAPANNGSGRMAFVHMVEFASSPEVDAIRKEMENTGFWDVPDHLNLHPIKLRFVINKNPVPKTEFTMETLADAVTRQGYIIDDHAMNINTFDGLMTKMQQNMYAKFAMMESRMAMMEKEHAKTTIQLSYEIQRANMAETELRHMKTEMQKMEARFQTVECDMTILYDNVNEQSDLVNGMHTNFEDKFKEIHSDIHHIEYDLMKKIYVVE